MSIAWFGQSSMRLGTGSGLVLISPDDARFRAAIAGFEQTAVARSRVGAVTV